MVYDKVAKDFSALSNVNIENKLVPILTSIEDMLVRLEEFQTMVQFAKQDQIDSSRVLQSIVSDLKGDVDELCNRVNAIESLVLHITSNLDMLETDISKYETDLRLTDSSIKVSNILIPLFKKSPEKKSTANSELFKTEDYFK